MKSTSQKKKQDQQFVWGKRSRKKWIIIGSSAGALIIAAVLGFVVFGLDFDSGDVATTKTDTSQGDLVRRAIDGVKVPVGDENLYPVAVMVENLTVSRPQAGLAQANLVYEALAEGGITRFMPIYAGKTPGRIGPVRSARPYFVDWALEYDALYAHAGGSPQALADIRSYDVFDLNQFFNSQYFFRDNSRDVAIEHTLYTTGENLAFALRDLEASADGDFVSWTFKDDAPLASRPVEEKAISIDYSSFSYSVEYQYNRETNSYTRYMAGDVHADEDGTEIAPKNVVVQKVVTALADEGRLTMETIGSGDAIVFRDGTAIVGTWQKDSRGDRTLYYDETGTEIQFNAGQTWIEILPTDREPVYN